MVRIVIEIIYCSLLLIQYTYQKDYDTFLKMVREDIQGANIHVNLGILYDDEKGDGEFHEIKDVLEGSNPYIGDILNKKWSLAEEYSYHLLVIQQVRNYF